MNEKTMKHDDVDLLLARLEADYRATIAATRERGHSEPMDEAASLEETRAAGYRQIGDDGADDVDEEDGYFACPPPFDSSQDSGSEDGEGQYAVLGNGDVGSNSDEYDDGDNCEDVPASCAPLAFDGEIVLAALLPSSFIESALPTRTAYEASLRLSNDERAALERSARECAELERGRVCAEAAGTGTDGRSSQSSSAHHVETDQHIRSDERTDRLHSASIVESNTWASFDEEASTQAPAGTASDEHLPQDRVHAIRHAMAGMSLSLPPPDWASSVPEDLWKQRLLRRTSQQ